MRRTAAAVLAAACCVCSEAGAAQAPDLNVSAMVNPVPRLHSRGFGVFPFGKSTLFLPALIGWASAWYGVNKTTVEAGTPITPMLTKKSPLPPTLKPDSERLTF